MKRTIRIIITLVLIMAETVINQGFQNPPGGGKSLIAAAISESEKEREDSEMAKTTDRHIVNGETYFMMDSEAREDIEALEEATEDLPEIRETTEELESMVKLTSGGIQCVKADAISGAAYMGLDSFEIVPSELKGRTVKIRYECDNSIFPDGMNFVSSNGKHISGNADWYLPNTDYIVNVSDSFADTASGRCGFYAPAEKVEGSGTVMALFYYGYERKSDKQLDGKYLWTLWDSLGHNTWQSFFKDITGCEFNSELNILSSKPISWGGSDSWPTTDDGTQARARNLCSYKGIYPIDIVIIENVNDINHVSEIGSESDAPFMRSQRIAIATGANSRSGAIEYAEENLSTILSNIAQSQRLKGTILSFSYTNGSSICGSKITFTHAPTSAGNISIVWGGNTFAIPVTVGMTTEDIAAEFAKYSFGAGVTDIASGSDLTITYYQPTDKRATFNGASTGVTATVVDSLGVSSYNLFFHGSGTSDWADTEKWTPNMTLYSVYKGLLSYLQTELPQARIYWSTPWAAGVDFSSNTYKDESGAWSVDLFTLPYEPIYEVQKKVCEMYSVPVLELDKKSGMSIINIETYFNSNDVHPKGIGYQRYASTMAIMIGDVP